MLESLITGEMLKELRLEQGLTQKKLAEKVGITQQAINLIEHNRRKLNIPLYFKLAEILDPECTRLVRLPFSNEEELTEYTEQKKQELFSDLCDSKTNEINELFTKLNDIGQDKAIEQVELLTKIPEYQKKDE